MLRVFLFFSIFYFLSVGFSLSNLTKYGTKPKTCPVNEEPSDCIEYCLPTCDKPKREPCIYYSCLAGCACKEDHIRETENGKCVPISSCVNPEEISRNYTAPCKENEERTVCVDCLEATCDLLEPPVCSVLMCSAGCVCKEGFVRLSSKIDNCVSKTSCKTNENVY